MFKTIFKSLLLISLLSYAALTEAGNVVIYYGTGQLANATLLQDQIEDVNANGGNGFTVFLVDVNTLYGLTDETYYEPKSVTLESFNPPQAIFGPLYEDWIPNSRGDLTYGTGKGIYTGRQITSSYHIIADIQLTHADHHTTNLDHVILLGTDIDIPPSHYYGNGTDRHPTDYFYSLKNFDDIYPDHGVSRISARDLNPGIAGNGTIVGEIGDSGVTSLGNDSIIWVNHNANVGADALGVVSVQVAGTGGAWVTSSVVANTALSGGAPAAFPSDLILISSTSTPLVDATTVANDTTQPHYYGYIDLLDFQPGNGNDFELSADFSNNPFRIRTGGIGGASRSFYNIFINGKHSLIPYGNGTVPDPVKTQEGLRTTGNTIGNVVPFNNANSGIYSISPGDFLYVTDAGLLYQINAVNANSIVLYSDRCDARNGTDWAAQNHIPANTVFDIIRTDHGHDGGGTFEFTQGDGVEIYASAGLTSEGVRSGNAYRLVNFARDTENLVRKICNWEDYLNQPPAEGGSLGDTWQKNVSLYPGVPSDGSTADPSGFNTFKIASERADWGGLQSTIFSGMNLYKYSIFEDSGATSERYQRNRYQDPFDKSIALGGEAFDHVPNLFVSTIFAYEYQETDYLDNGAIFDNAFAGGGYDLGTKNVPVLFHTWASASRFDLFFDQGAGTDVIFPEALLYASNLNGGTDAQYSIGDGGFAAPSATYGGAGAVFGFANTPKTVGDDYHFSRGTMLKATYNYTGTFKKEFFKAYHDLSQSDVFLGELWKRTLDQYMRSFGDAEALMAAGGEFRTHVFGFNLSGNAAGKLPKKDGVFITESPEPPNIKFSTGGSIAAGGTSVEAFNSFDMPIATISNGDTAETITINLEGSGSSHVRVLLYGHDSETAIDKGVYSSSDTLSFTVAPNSTVGAAVGADFHYPQFIMVRLESVETNGTVDYSPTVALTPTTGSTVHTTKEKRVYLECVNEFPTYRSTDAFSSVLGSVPILLVDDDKDDRMGIYNGLPSNGASWIADVQRWYMQALDHYAYTLGTVSVANGSKAVTGNSTNWDVDKHWVGVGDKIRFRLSATNSWSGWYRIAAINTNTTSLTLAVNYNETSVSNGTYQISRAYTATLGQAIGRATYTPGASTLTIHTSAALDAAIGGAGTDYTDLISPGDWVRIYQTLTPANNSFDADPSSQGIWLPIQSITAAGVITLAENHPEAAALVAVDGGEVHFSVIPNAATGIQPHPLYAIWNTWYKRNSNDQMTGFFGEGIHGQMSAEIINQFSTPDREIIWFSGMAGDKDLGIKETVINSTDAARLATMLSNKGRLFLSGENVLDTYPDSNASDILITSYLKVTPTPLDMKPLNSVTDNPITDGFTAMITASGSSSGISNDPDALAFAGSAASSMLTWDNPTKDSAGGMVRAGAGEDINATVYTAFGLEQISGVGEIGGSGFGLAGRFWLTKNIVDWLRTPTVTGDGETFSILADKTSVASNVAVKLMLAGGTGIYHVEWAPGGDVSGATIVDLSDNNIDNNPTNVIVGGTSAVPQAVLKYISGFNTGTDVIRAYQLEEGAKDDMGNWASYVTGSPVGVSISVDPSLAKLTINATKNTVSPGNTTANIIATTTGSGPISWKISAGNAFVQDEALTTSTTTMTNDTVVFTAVTMNDILSDPNLDIPGTVTLFATDGSGNTATVDITITAADITVSPSVVTMGQFITKTFTASGGTVGNYVWGFQTNNSGGTLSIPTGPDSNTIVYTSGTGSLVTVTDTISVYRETPGPGVIATAVITVDPDTSGGGDDDDGSTGETGDAIGGGGCVIELLK